MGAYLSSPKKEKTYSFGFDSRKQIRYICCGMQGWRRSMEDAHMAVVDLNSRYSLFGVFDGHGGQEVAKFCEKYYPRVLLEQLDIYEGDPEKALINSFLQIDQLLDNPQYRKELIRLKQLKSLDTTTTNNIQLDNIQQFEEDENEQYFSCSFVGCTANVVLYDSITNELLVANAGDAKCVLMKNQNIYELTTDHKPDDTIEKLRIEKAGGSVFAGRVNGNLNVSRALGDLQFKSNTELNLSQQLVIPIPDITKNSFSGHGIEFFVIGCDGVWEKMGCNYVLQKLENGLKNQISIVDLLESLFDDIISPSVQENPKGCDNMSLVIVINNTEQIQKLEPIIDSKFLNDSIPTPENSNKPENPQLNSGNNKNDSDTLEEEDKLSK